VAKTPTGDVEVQSSTKDVTTILHTAGTMPRVTRSSGPRSDSVKQLAEAIKDGQSHYLAVNEQERDKWRRALIYAAKVAGKDVKTVFLREPGPDGEEPGLYFIGKDAESNA
jgi:hypothetical protein